MARNCGWEGCCCWEVGFLHIRNTLGTCWFHLGVSLKIGVLEFRRVAACFSRHQTLNFSGSYSEKRNNNKIIKVCIWCMGGRCHLIQYIVGYVWCQGHLSLFLVVLMFEFRVLCLLGRSSTNRAVTLAPFALVVFEIGSHFMPGQTSTVLLLFTLPAYLG
jgi:hypothetical protein